MSYKDGRLFKNEIGRWEIEGHEFSSGSCLEIRLGGHWIKGYMEYSGEDYYLCTKEEGMPVKLYKNMNARVKNSY